MTVWHRSTNLRVVARDALGTTEAQRKKACDEIHPLRASEWEDATDPAYLLPEYASDWYALTLVECFCGYTRGNTRSFAKWWNENGYEGTVLDLGAGIGASSRLFQELTGAETLCHVYSPGSQLEIARKITKGIVVGEDERAILVKTRPVGVMAFELFEHVQDPIELITAITDSTAKVLCVCNSFGARDFGHWRRYHVGRKWIPYGSMGRVFGRAMREQGWIKQKTAYWNDRPSIWTRRQYMLGSRDI